MRGRDIGGAAIPEYSSITCLPRNEGNNRMAVPASSATIAHSTIFGRPSNSATYAITLKASERVHDALTALAKRDGLTPAGIIVRAVMAYAIIYPAHHLGNDGYGCHGALRRTTIWLPEVILDEIDALMERDGLSLAVWAARAIDGYSLMYPGCGYRPA